MKLKDIASIRTGLVLSRKKATLVNADNFNYKQVTLKSFSESTSLMLDHIDDFSAEEEISESYISQEGDVLVRLREPVTAVYVDKESKGMVVPSFVSIVRVNNDLVDKQFLAHYINSNIAQKLLEKMMKQASIFGLKTKDLEDLQVVFPSLDEQKRVVELLRVAQNEINLLEELTNQKKQFSQAVLDTIITRNKEEN